ncbi:MAG TPA: hypothetical protein VER33_24935 [Polyangiaceae bacterium]|nr:hypothetical protein [Polyangiaceae bacterium]
MRDDYTLGLSVTCAEAKLIPWLAACCLALSCRAGDPTRAGAGAGAGPPLGKARGERRVEGRKRHRRSHHEPSSRRGCSTCESVAEAEADPLETFPEGIDEATVCEAIDSTEPDLWVRFGHIIPPDIEGSIYIVETGPESKDKLYRYISRDYVWGYDSQQASCRGNLTLLYIRKMFEESVVDGRPFGRKHLSQAIERKFGIKTMASFQFTDRDSERLAQYCRVDSELAIRSTSWTSQIRQGLFFSSR